MAVTLLLVAAILIFFVGDDADTGFATAAAAACDEYEVRISNELALTFPEGPPTVEAEAEYLGRAFADTVDDLVAELRGLEGSGAVAGAVDAMAARVEDIRADPAQFVAAQANPFADGVAGRFDDAGIPACGSEFLGGAE